jgi:hypothetical protein
MSGTTSDDTATGELVITHTSTTAALRITSSGSLELLDATRDTPPREILALLRQLHRGRPGAPAGTTAFRLDEAAQLMRARCRSTQRPPTRSGFAALLGMDWRTIKAGLALHGLDWEGFLRYSMRVDEAA